MTNFTSTTLMLGSLVDVLIYRQGHGKLDTGVNHTRSSSDIVIRCSSNPTNHKRLCVKPLLIFDRIFDQYLIELDSSVKAKPPWKLSEAVCIPSLFKGFDTEENPLRESAKRGPNYIIEATTDKQISSQGNGPQWASLNKSTDISSITPNPED